MGVELRDSGPGRERAGGGIGAAALAGLWAIGAAVAYWLGDAAQVEFLDLPLGAYVAGQGAIMAVAVMAFRVTGADG